MTETTAPTLTKQERRRINLIVLGVLGALFGASALIVALANLGGSPDVRADDACSEAYINDTAALARCYQMSDTVGSDDAVEIQREVDQMYGR